MSSSAAPCIVVPRAMRAVMSRDRQEATNRLARLSRSPSPPVTAPCTCVYSCGREYPCASTRASGTALNRIRERPATYLDALVHTHASRLTYIRVKGAERVVSERANLHANALRIRHETRRDQRRESRPVNRATHYHKCAPARPTRKSVSQIARVGLCHLPTALFLSRSSSSRTERIGWMETSRPSTLFHLRLRYRSVPTSAFLLQSSRIVIRLSRVYRILFGSNDFSELSLLVTPR